MPLHRLPLHHPRNRNQRRVIDRDIAAVREAITPLVDASRDVVLVMHSWGGLPCCSGLKGLARADRQEKGLGGGVRYLFFFSSFFPKAGDDLKWLFAETNTNWLVVNVCIPLAFSLDYVMPMRL